MKSRGSKDNHEAEPILTSSIQVATCTFTSTPSTGRHSKHTHIHRHLGPHQQASSNDYSSSQRWQLPTRQQILARSSCRVNVPCVTPCSSFVASANISRGRRVLCGASRRENGRRKGDFERQACPQRGGTCARAGKNA
jgi:hypothetical protein